MKHNWFKSGAPWIWLNGGAVALCMVMVFGLLGLIAIRGFGHFWPADILQTTVTDRSGARFIVMGEAVRNEVIAATVARDGGYEVDDNIELIRRHLFKLGNRDLTGRDFVWFLETGMDAWQFPADAVVIARREWGDFFGFAEEIYAQGNLVSRRGDPDFWQELETRVARSLALHKQIRAIEKHDIGRVNHGLDRLRLERRRLELRNADAATLAEADEQFAARRAVLDAEYEMIRGERDLVLAESRRDLLLLRAADGTELQLPFAQIVRVTRPNAMGLGAKLLHYGDRLWEFVSDEPREANTEGGIFPAIFGTVTMVMVMAIMVTPFGVLAAIYLREYAKQGPVLKLIRISVYNLAGVPSIVYGVFGLGFFVYYLGGNIDRLFYAEGLPSPTFGTPGLFWASLTLALLTLPVVIVSTEEGLARIPGSIREGSLALGATKSETLWKVVVPLATPAMMTGLILAVARAAGEVAPLMLVGVVKLAPSLPIDGNPPYLHLDQKIMHLGFHIFDVGFQSPNVEAARPLVYATALILVILIVILNLAAIKIRNNLREKYRSDSE